MKLDGIDVLKKASQFLNKDELALYLQEGYNNSLTALESELVMEQNILANCMFEAYSEIATDYHPLYNTEVIIVSNGKFDLTDLQKTFKSVKHIKDNTDNEVKDYSIEYDYLYIKDGTYTLKYRYIPNYNEVALDKMQNFDGKISESVLSFGVCAYYCLKNNLSDSYSLWETKFKQSLLISMQKTENLFIKPRRFV